MIEHYYKIRPIIYTNITYFNKYIAGKNEILYSEEGYYSKKGEDALTAAPEVKTKLDKLRKELLQTGSNDQVKAMFGISSESRYNTEVANIDKYSNQEREEYHDLISKARLSALEDEVSRNWDDPEYVLRSLTAAKAEVIGIAERKGWSHDVVE